jgi:hypothetical protein
MREPVTRISISDSEARLLNLSSPAPLAGLAGRVRRMVIVFSPLAITSRPVPAMSSCAASTAA